MLDGLSPEKVADKTLDVSKAFQIGIDRFVTVDKYNFQVRVKIGQYYKNQNGQWVYGNKGVVLAEQEWIELLKSASGINAIANKVANGK